MVSNVYKTQNQNGLISDHVIANLLVTGFTGQLKGWWDHALTKTQQEEILKAIKKDDQGRIILDEQGREIQDAVATLIFSTSKHFIGDPSNLKDKNSELLSNLKCKKLTNFKWYKEVFMTRVMQRSNNSNDGNVQVYTIATSNKVTSKCRVIVPTGTVKRIIYDAI
ncbi:hypothetical protein PVK06_043598 [Gossypium arboreum]|uniref:DUF7746 domain-containing protein n=1 Tax=Gossypium arboreum TaxID=29729 RepID=A0ABR0MNZ6_GOSAR|nr:hypothetical protein PVK06_043598 [Gossypium arboreum]